MKFTYLNSNKKNELTVIDNDDDDGEFKKRTQNFEAFVCSELISHYNTVCRQRTNEQKKKNMLKPLMNK